MSREFMNSIGEANWDKSPQSKTGSSTPSQNTDATEHQNDSNDEDDTKQDDEEEN